MARKIDLDKPLSKKDRAWLEDWGKHDQIAAHDAQFDPQPEPKDDLDEPDGEDVPFEDGDPDGPGTDRPYVEWTNDELRDELGDRELSKSGSKAELIARLEEDDLP